VVVYINGVPDLLDVCVWEVCEGFRVQGLGFRV